MIVGVRMQALQRLDFTQDGEVITIRKPMASLGLELTVGIGCMKLLGCIQRPIVQHLSLSQ